MSKSHEDAEERERAILKILVRQALAESDRLEEERAPRYCQKRIPCLAQVFINPRKASRQSRPKLLRVPPEIFRLVTWQRMSFSDPLVCKGMSGRSSTNRSSLFWALSRLKSRSSVA